MGFVLIFLFPVNNGSYILRSLKFLNYIHITLLKVFVVHFFTLLNERIDNKYLSAGCNLLLHKGVNPLPLVFACVNGFYRLSAWRQFINHRYIKVSIEGHCQSSWYWSGGHYKYVGDALSFVPQFCTLFYSKTVLLINHRKTQIFELNNIFNQSVCSKQNINFTIYQLHMDRFTLFCLCVSCQQSALYTSALKELLGAFEVLNSKNLCWSHYARLITVVSSQQSSENGD